MERELTTRQREILKLLADGYTKQEAGVRLGISYSTIKDHCSNAYRRLGLRRPRAVTAIIEAVRTGQITLG